MIRDQNTNAVFLSEMDVWALSELIGFLAHSWREEGDLGGRGYVKHKYERMGLDGATLEEAVENLCSHFDIDDELWTPARPPPGGECTTIPWTQRCKCDGPSRAPFDFEKHGDTPQCEARCPHSFDGTGEGRCSLPSGHECPHVSGPFTWRDAPPKAFGSWQFGRTATPQRCGKTCDLSPDKKCSLHRGHKGPHVAGNVSWTKDMTHWRY